MPLRGFQYDTLLHAAGPALTPRRVSTWLKRHGWALDGVRIAEHPRSGRNRLFVVEGLAGRTWLVKQPLNAPGAETWFYARVAPRWGLAPACLIADAEADVVAVAYLDGATPLHRLARRDAAAAFSACVTLAPGLARLHGLAAADAPPARLPFPDLDPIDVHFWIGGNPAARAFVAAVQGRPRLVDVFRDALRGAGPQGLVHGDLKFDNVLQTPDRLVVVDWEVCGRGALGWDLGALLGSMVAAWTDGSTRSAHPAAEIPHAAPSFDDLARAVCAFMDAYLDHAARAGLVVPNRGLAATHAAAWIVGRSWVEAAWSLYPAPHLLWRLLVAEELVEHPAHLFGTLTW